MSTSKNRGPVVVFLCLLLLLSSSEFTFKPLWSQGLKPLQPSQFSSRQLRLEPSDQSPLLRDLFDSDRVVILRSEGEWYEVDIETLDKLSFRGWLKGTLATERIAPAPLDLKLPEKKDPLPLASNKYIWFWDRKAQDTAYLTAHIGGSGLFYKLQGANAGGARSTIYDYSFTGFSLGLAGELPILRTKLSSRDLIWSLEASYFYGLFGLSFGSDFSVPELQGVGYRIDTHTYRVQSLLKLRLIDNPANTLALGFGAGYYAHEVLPDLQPIRSGTYSGQLVFVETSIHGLSVPIRADGSAATHWLYGVTFAPILLSDVSETGSQTPDLEASGFSYLATLNFGYEWSRSLSILGEIEQLSAKAKSSRLNLTRLGSDYSSPEVQFSYVRGTLGFRFGF